MKRILILLLTPLLVLPFIAQPALATPGPITSPITVTSLVNGPPPGTPPTIDSPTNGQIFSSSQQTVTGSCITGLTVRIFRNSVFAGSTICSAGTFSILLTLITGNNALVARQYDGLNQPSADSNIVSVVLNSSAIPKPTTTAIAVPVSQLMLVCDYSANRGFVDQMFRLPCQITGGISPYAISVDWGDGTTSVIVRDTQGNFVLEHIYKSAGNYLIKIAGTDKEATDVLLQMAISVSGKQDIVSQLTAPLYQCKPDVLIPLLGLLVVALLILLVSYFIGRQRGEKLELEELRKEHRIKNPPGKK